MTCVQTIHGRRQPLCRLEECAGTPECKLRHKQKLAAMNASSVDEIEKFTAEEIKAAQENLRRWLRGEQACARWKTIINLLEKLEESKAEYVESTKTLEEKKMEKELKQAQAIVSRAEVAEKELERHRTQLQRDLSTHMLRTHKDLGPTGRPRLIESATKSELEAALENKNIIEAEAILLGTNREAAYRYEKPKEVWKYIQPMLKTIPKFRLRAEEAEAGEAAKLRIALLENELVRLREQRATTNAKWLQYHSDQVLDLESRLVSTREQIKADSSLSGHNGIPGRCQWISDQADRAEENLAGHVKERAPRSRLSFGR